MGCASSKPSSSKKGKKQQQNDNKLRKGSKQQQQQQSQLTSPETKRRQSFQANKEQISINDELFTQITRNEKSIIDFIFNRVKNELNNESLHYEQYNNNHYSQEKKTNLADIALLASRANDNDDMINDVSSRAISLIQSGKCRSTYQHLLDSLLSNKYLCAKQNNKQRICELTVDTIRDCLSSLNDYNTNNNTSNSNNNNNFDIMDYLHQHAAKNSNNEINEDHKLSTTPVTPPPDLATHADADWSSKGIPLTRIQANYIARIMFLSTRSRPVVRSSPVARGAYFVNQTVDGTNDEITLTQQEIDEILYTFKDANTAIKNNNLSYQTPSNQTTTGATNNIEESKINYYSNGTPSLPLTPPLDTPILKISHKDDDDDQLRIGDGRPQSRNLNSQLELEANNNDTLNLDSFQQQHNTLTEQPEIDQDKEEEEENDENNNNLKNIIKDIQITDSNNNDNDNNNDNNNNNGDGYDIERNIQMTTTRTTERIENQDGDTVIIDETLNVVQIEEPAKIIITKNEEEQEEEQQAKDEEGEAATKIQASIRGFLTRKNLKNHQQHQQKEGEINSTEQQQQTPIKEEEEEHKVEGSESSKQTRNESESSSTSSAKDETQKQQQPNKAPKDA